MGLYIGLNGDSLKSSSQFELVRNIPLDSLLISTNSPSSAINEDHPANMYIKTRFPTTRKETFNPEKVIKNRNEPCLLV